MNCIIIYQCLKVNSTDTLVGYKAYLVLSSPAAGKSILKRKV